MWPFTGKRIFGNRWWAVAFAVFVCWQAVELTEDAGPAADLNAVDGIGSALANIG